MRPLDWLRRQPQPLSPLHRARILEACEAADVPVQPIAGPMPVAVVQIDGVVSRADEEEVRRALTVSPRPRSVECGCWPRYSECRCSGRTEQAT